MQGKQLAVAALFAAVTCLPPLPTWVLAADLKAANIMITIPKRTKPTEVQLLNREGVEAVRKRQYDRAATFFYKAYLFDSSDPFTLFNLGYISEMQGDLERAKKFYDLASEQSNDAVIDRSSSKALEKKPMKDAFGDLQNSAMTVNRGNISAIRLFSEGQAPEAENILQQNLAIDSRNPFTLNNLGVAKEEEGDLDAAITYYSQAAAIQSSDKATITLKNVSRGTPISQLAAESSHRVSQRLQAAKDPAAQAALLNMRGVLAANRNDPQTAKQDFLRAYALDPNSAFSLNNAGYVSEMSGDLETADFFYQKAKLAPNAGDPVGLATQKASEGSPLIAVADLSDQKVDAQLASADQARRQHPGPIELKHRDNTPVVEPPAQAPIPSRGASRPTQ